MQENQPECSTHEGEIPSLLNEAQILAVMDQLLVMEATWHRGSVLAQTVYTCQYLLHQPRSWSSTSQAFEPFIITDVLLLISAGKAGLC